MDEYYLCDIFDGYYQVTNDGRLYSVRRSKWLRPNTDKYGYLYYVISINSERHTLKAHKLVAECYIPNPENKPTVDHINGDRKDNRVDNLRWATYKEQQCNEITRQRSSELWAKTDYKAMGMKRNYGRKPVIVSKDGNIVGEYPSLLEAAKSIHITYSKASEYANNKRKNKDGYELCFV